MFGGVRRSVEAAQAELEASQANLRDVPGLPGGRGGPELHRGAHLSRAPGRGQANLKAQENTYDYISSRHEAGLVNRLALEQARYNLENTRSRIPSLTGRAGRLASTVWPCCLGQTPGKPVGALMAAPRPRCRCPRPSIAVGMPGPGSAGAGRTSAGPSAALGRPERQGGGGRRPSSTPSSAWPAPSAWKRHQRLRTCCSPRAPFRSLGHFAQLLLEHIQRRGGAQRASRPRRRCSERGHAGLPGHGAHRLGRGGERPDRLCPGAAPPPRPCARR